MRTNPMLVEALKAYGLNKKQALLYLACLEFGSSAVRDLAKRSGLKRTTIYSLLEELENAGLVNFVKRGKKTYVAARPGEALLRNISERREKIVQSLPFFRALEKEPGVRPKIVFYRGGEGFRNFWRDLLYSGVREWLILTSGKEFLTFVSESYVTGRIIKEKKRLGVKSRQIITDSRYAREIVRKDKAENRESVIVGIEFPLPAIEIIFGDRVAIISSNFDNVLVVIQSAEVAQFHRSCFEMIWKSARAAPSLS